MIEAVEAFAYVQLLEPVLVIVGAVLIGLIIRWILLIVLNSWAQRNSWYADNVMINVVKNVVVFWFTLLGLYLAVSTPLFAPRITGTIQTAVLIAFVGSTTLVLIRIGTGLVRTYDRNAEGSSALTIIINIIRITATIVGLIIILQILNVPVTPAIAAFGVGGLAVSLALQDTLSNLFSGIMIILSHQIRPGNYVRLSTGEEGYVVDINWRNTQIRQLANNMITVPNAVLTSQILTNYHDPTRELAILIDVGVSYDSDLQQVERVTIEVAQQVMHEVPGGVPDFTPFIRYNAFGDFQIKFTVILRGQEFVDQFLIKHEFIKRLHARYRQEGIEIPFPIRTIYSRNSMQQQPASVSLPNYPVER